MSDIAAGGAGTAEASGLAATLRHARGRLGLGRILAITTQDNEPSMRLLAKLDFRFERLVTMGDEELRLFVSDP